LTWAEEVELDETGDMCLDEDQDLMLEEVSNVLKDAFLGKDNLIYSNLVDSYKPRFLRRSLVSSLDNLAFLVTGEILSDLHENSEVLRGNNTLSKVVSLIKAKGVSSYTEEDVGGVAEALSQSVTSMSMQGQTSEELEESLANVNQLIPQGKGRILEGLIRTRTKIESALRKVQGDTTFEMLFDLTDIFWDQLVETMKSISPQKGKLRSSSIGMNQSIMILEICIMLERKRDLGEISIDDYRIQVDAIQRKTLSRITLSCLAEAFGISISYLDSTFGKGPKITITESGELLTADW
jgi:hypothetical protein